MAMSSEECRIYNGHVIPHLASQLILYRHIAQYIFERTWSSISARRSADHHMPRHSLRLSYEVIAQSPQVVEDLGLTSVTPSR